MLFDCVLCVAFDDVERPDTISKCLFLLSSLFIVFQLKEVKKKLFSGLLLSSLILVDHHYYFPLQSKQRQLNTQKNGNNNKIEEERWNPFLLSQFII